MNKGNLIMLGLLAICTLGFCINSILVVNHAIDKFDIFVTIGVQSVRSYTLTQCANILAKAGAPRLEMMAAISVAIAGAVATFIFWRQWFSAAFPKFFVFGMGGIVTFYANNWLKHFFHRTRPMEGILSYSYPSGHTMESTAIYLLAAFLLWGSVPSRAGRCVITAVCCVMPLLIGISRIYLGVHYPSDVVGAIFAGGWIAIFFVLLYQRQLNREE
jgi:undecaprenyl-diphosphatase